MCYEESELLLYLNPACLLQNYNNNNNIHICIAPYGRNFRGAGPGSVLVGVRRGKRVSLGELIYTDIPVKDDIVATEPRIKVKNNKFSSRLHTYKNGRL